MRDKYSDKLESARVRAGKYWSNPGEGFGAFEIHGPCGSQILIMASDGVGSDAAGWEHVSVSIKHRTPNWKEMCFVKDLFWNPEEEVVQFHPARSDYVNCHPNCLHLWRHKTAVIPMPPSILVGYKTEGQ
jgi:hypothetical protein